MKKGFIYLPQWLRIMLMSALSITLVSVAGLMYLTADIVFSQPFNPVSAETAPNTDVEPEMAQPQNLPPLISDITASNEGEEVAVEALPATATPIPALETNDRINILVMGIDRRPGEPFISRTDSMILLSINPTTEKASMLSIPRDLYVNIPGHFRNRINTAFVFGARGGEPEDGAALSMETVERNLGVHVDHYILVDFSVVINLVDSMGGVTIDVAKDIYDPTYPDMNYGYDPLYITAGTHTLDGEMALKYARTRHGDNDFERALRQQQVIMTLRNQVFADGVPEFLARVPFLYRDIRDGIYTDLSLEQMLKLAKAATAISADQIDSAVLNYDYVSSYTTPEGASVLVPVNEKVSTLIQSLYGD